MNTRDSIRRQNTMSKWTHNRIVWPKRAWCMTAIPSHERVWSIRPDYCRNFTNKVNTRRKTVSKQATYPAVSCTSFSFSFSLDALCFDLLDFVCDVVLVVTVVDAFGVLCGGAAKHKKAQKNASIDDTSMQRSEEQKKTLRKTVSTVQYCTDNAATSEVHVLAWNKLHDEYNNSIIHVLQDILRGSEECLELFKTKNGMETGVPCL